ncbi:MAG: hypothetical protein P8Q37_11275 [Porticoccaceae bacterium]|nr:hypothetical protein [Porticoccaceae bacterium]MDG1475478.1 hypothetical protein [Porticoccaceae bacterium]
MYAFDLMFLFPGGALMPLSMLDAVFMTGFLIEVIRIVVILVVLGVDLELKEYSSVLQGQTKQSLS